MEKLLDILKKMPEYTAALQTLSEGKTAAITGIGQINRSHIVAGLHTHLEQPLVVICQDDLAAKRLNEELKAFLGQEFPVLPSRELTLYDSAVVSRGWEQKRLRQLYDLASSVTQLQIIAWDALSQRTLPPVILNQAAFRLEIGKEYPIEELIRQLTECGYSRCGMVEGAGQFAVRGGILDVYSPAAEFPVRAELILCLYFVHSKEGQTAL